METHGGRGDGIIALTQKLTQTADDPQENQTSEQRPAENYEPTKLGVVLALFATYVIWGSTFIAWTWLLNALNAERQWPLKRLYELLDPMLEPGIAIAAVPPHRAFQAFWPLRILAQRLAANGRVDASSCLVRHTTIRRIIYGGPSTRALHRQTIQVEDRELVEGQRVLLLDDIAKSGASLVACRELLQEAGAKTVQAAALGRVIVDVHE